MKYVHAVLSFVTHSPPTHQLHSLTHPLLVLYIRVKGKDDYTGQDVGMLTRIDPMTDLSRTELRVDYPLPSTHCSSR